MLSETRFSNHFKIIGDRSVHYGEFVCGDTLASQQYSTTNSTDSGACC